VSKGKKQKKRDVTDCVIKLSLQVKKTMHFTSLYQFLQILVATPGRLLDHIENKSGISLRLMGLRMLVLDEADHLLDLGFRKDVEKIVDCLPRQRQSLLFSATIPKEVRLDFFFQ